MQYTSLDNINPINLKSFFRRLCIVSNRYVHKDKQLETTTKRMLSSRVKQLEEQLQLATEEKNSVLKENRNKINELNIALIPLKEQINKLLQAKTDRQERFKHLESKIKKKVK